MHRIKNSGSLSDYIVFGLAALGAGLLLFRAMPDLVRYLRIRRM
ncbi:MAG TPA: hypothetical protein VH853_16615 [Polyangia bacterium]|jgi:hypothetical protein|nr:hypothetical protein [Polyangia bacterium]